MSVYMIVEVKTKNAEKYRQYLSLVPETVARHGGRFLAWGAEVTPLLGGWKPERVIVLEFPSETRVREWLASPEYIAILPLRKEGAEVQAVLVQSCAEQPQ